MAETVGQHGVAAFTSPSNGDALDATVVKGNDNSIRSAYVDHDSDPGIHVQSSLLAARPAAGVAGRKWITTDTGSVKMWFDNGSTWENVTATATGTLTLGAYLSGTSYNGSAAVTTNVNGATASTANTLVARDASGEASLKKLNLDGVSSGTVGIQAAASAGTWTATLPTSAGTNGQVLSTNGAGVLSWSTLSAANISISETTTAASFYPVFFNALSGTTAALNTDSALSWNPGTNTLSANTVTVTSDLTVDTTTLRVDATNNRVGIGTASPTATLDVIGAASVRSVEFDGTTSGTVTVQPAATAGTWSLTLPTTAGTNGQVLTTNGSGVTSWGSPAQPLDEQTFNSSGTWTKPSVGSMALIEVWASGGGGSNSTTTGASGGAGGNYMFRIVPLNALSATASITVGAGGVGAAASTNNSGGAGNQSSFSGTVTVTAPGSQTAQNNFTACPDPYVNNGGGVSLFQINGTAGSVSSAQIAQMAIVDGKFSGGYGGSGATTVITSSSVYGGGGGAAQGGAAAGISTYGGNGGAVGANGTAPGGGGGSGNNTTAAGSGAAGRVKVTVW